MKKRNCRMTNEEKAVHEFAVKIRKMTDKQLYDFVKSSNECEKSKDLYTFIDGLETQSGNGIGPATVRKIKEYAIKEGYIIGN